MGISSVGSSTSASIYERLRDPQRMFDPKTHIADLRELCDSSGQSTMVQEVQSRRTGWDSNKDNNLTKTELSESLAKLEEDIKNKVVDRSYAKNELIDDSQSTSDGDVLNRMYYSLRLGRQLLENFDAVAKIDGKSDGISRSDLQRLASAYGSDTTISYGDFDIASRDFQA